MEIAGRYVLDREVGRGGMGAVWLGTDTVLGRQVALKRLGLAPGVGSPDLERAEREARLAARLNHPHVVAVFDLVREGSDHWLVMEYVEGRTLAELIRQDGALTPDEAAPLLRQAAAALAAAHESGIVHRDVKPSNMLVTSEGQVKLSDFGIARAEADASLTQTGLVTGSPAYLSPEVASGQMATAAADVWSLGATAFHALAGRPPYEVGDNVMGALYRIVHEDPPRLANAGWLGPLLDSTMTKEPGARWPMAKVRDFLDDGVLPASMAAGPAETGTATVVQGTPPVPVPQDGTQVLTQVPAPAPPSPPPERRRGAGGAIVWALLAMLAVALFLLFAWLFGAFDPQEGTAEDSSPGGSPTNTRSTPEGSTPPESTATAQASEEEMRSFVTDYVALAVEDPQSSWQLLTPEFQEASGNFGQYQGFWNQWESATVSDIRADPATLTVAYTVTYVPSDSGGNGDSGSNGGEDGEGSGEGGSDEGEAVVDDVTLVLEEDGAGGFLIAGER